MLASQALYALAWASFAAGHSLLASDRVKERMGRLLGAGYRLAYNGFAVVHFTAVWVVGRLLFHASPPFDRPPWLFAMMVAMMVVGLVVLAVALRGYDLARFAGFAQLAAAPSGRAPIADEPLRTDGPHRYVRHPLYSGLFLVLWGMADGPLGLATAIWGSAYLVIGTNFEERKLLRLYGAAYGDYCARVPAFVPWRGRAIA